MLDRTGDFDSGVIRARPEDVASPRAIVRALYQSISGPGDAERDWDRIRSLFDPKARFLIGRWLADPAEPKEVVFEWDLEAFLAEGRAYWLGEGFWESELVGRIERFGNVAHVLSSYESRTGSEDSEPIGRGVNSVQLIRHADRWWITSIVWDVETSATPLPEGLRG